MHVRRPTFQLNQAARGKADHPAQPIGVQVTLRASAASSCAQPLAISLAGQARSSVSDLEAAGERRQGRRFDLPTAPRVWRPARAVAPS
jgi:hypothetical protein